MKKLTASVLGMDFFDGGEMDELLEKAVIQNGTVTFYFKDGHTEIRTYQERKRGYLLPACAPAGREGQKNSQG